MVFLSLKKPVSFKGNRLQVFQDKLWISTVSSAARLSFETSAEQFDLSSLPKSSVEAKVQDP
jgi:hypothetical protein